MGDDKAFQELKDRYPDACPCWYHMMVGKLLFSYPTIISSDYELIHVAEVTETAIILMHFHSVYIIGLFLYHI